MNKLSEYLSEYLNEELIMDLKLLIQKGDFPGVSYKNAMAFILNDGILPESGLPAKSFLMLEDWVKSRGYKVVRFSATDLKNSTGLVVQKALEGNRVYIERHGRAILEIRRISTDDSPRE